MSPDAPVRPGPSRRLPLVLGAVGIGAIGLVVFGLSDRAKSTLAVKAWTDEQAIPTVRIVRPSRGPVDEPLILPGTVSAFYAGSLFARATGYVTAWHKTIGAHVAKGEVLAEISAPDLDQQLVEAKAQLVQLQAAVEQAQANADLSQTTNRRTTQLVAQGWSSAERGDTDRLTAASRNAALAVANANVAAQKAVVGRLDELSAFKQIRAPFDGIVTARNVDIGDLVAAGGNTGRALFQIADIHRMRIFVNVPQAFLSGMKPGVSATLHIPGQTEVFAATLVSTSNALAENSRTALIELQADNPDGTLWPGAFTEVHFNIPSNPNILRIPATALVFGAHGLRVATLDGADKVVLKPVAVGHNLGNEVEIQSGISVADRLIDNPQESVETGDVVQVAGADRKAANVAVVETVDPRAARND